LIGLVRRLIGEVGQLRKSNDKLNATLTLEQQPAGRQYLIADSSFDSDLVVKHAWRTVQIKRLGKHRASQRDRRGPQQTFRRLRAGVGVM